MDIERYLDTNASTLALTGALLGLRRGDFESLPKDQQTIEPSTYVHAIMQAVNK